MPHSLLAQRTEHIAVEAGAVCLSYRTLNRRAVPGPAVGQAGLMPGMPLLVPTRGSLQGVLLPGPACGQGGSPAESGVSRGSALRWRGGCRSRVCQPESDFVTLPSCRRSPSTTVRRPTSASHRSCTRPAGNPSSPPAPAAAQAVAPGQLASVRVRRRHPVDPDMAGCFRCRCFMWRPCHCVSGLSGRGGWC